MRQINAILERTPEGFETRVNVAIQAIGSEHLRKIRSMMRTPTEPDRLADACIAIPTHDRLETGREEG